MNDSGLEGSHCSAWEPLRSTRTSWSPQSTSTPRTPRSSEARAGFWLGRPVDELLMDALPGDFPGPSALVPSIS
ncbi:MULTISPECIES: hypothetical protein [Streptomyces]|uniref:hypothetical protein n=1 Tax=Streptomyces TaxID=1883 RepID=UPI00136B0DC6|nr:hypothetical protein [Streptomyces sp. SID2888]MYV50091.1 hypothetical protein [Streptomyces sp. SID2888]